MKNLLFLGGGRRYQLYNYFKNYFNLYSYELDWRVPVASISRILEGKKWSECETHLCTTIRNFNIHLVVPLQDEATVVLSNLPEIWGTEYVVSSPEVTEICYNKKKFEKWMLDNFKEHYPVAVEYNKSFPYFHYEHNIIKPITGHGSINIDPFSDPFKYTGEALVDEFVSQRRIKGTEYSVDTYFDREGNWVMSVPRERIRVGSSGEVVTSKTADFPELINITKEIGSELGIIGPCNFQYMIDEETNKPYLFEINARLGGGYTLSMASGLNVDRYIHVEYIENKKLLVPMPENYTKNLLLERAYKDFVFTVKN